MGVDEPPIGDALGALRRILDTAKMRDGYADHVSVEITSVEANGFRAGVKWLAIAAEFGTGFERLAYSIEECRGFLQGHIESFRICRAAEPNKPLIFKGDHQDVRYLRAAERYLDRMSLINEINEKPRQKPKWQGKKK